MGNRGSLTFAREESAASGTRHAEDYPAASGPGQVYPPSRARFRRCMRNRVRERRGEHEEEQGCGYLYQGAVVGVVVYLCMLLPKKWNGPPPSMDGRRTGRMQVE